jgi:undecaprenyl diphosphate synthase
MPDLSSKRLAAIFSPLPEGIDLDSLDASRIPAHIAVIMDGNGRWAKARGLSRSAGHKAGIKGVRELIRTSSDIGVRYLTIYSFSTENWSRPQREVMGLMALFARTMEAELDGMHAEGVRIRIIGDIQGLPARTRDTFTNAVERTGQNCGMSLVIAVNYGARREILRAAQMLASRAAEGLYAPEQLGSEEFIEAAFTSLLDTAQMPDPDLLIRTSGESRLSNFLLYQSAYSELYVTPVLWPDFDRFELLRAILDYQRRERRFGAVK